MALQSKPPRRQIWTPTNEALHLSVGLKPPLTVAISTTRGKKVETTLSISAHMFYLQIVCLRATCPTGASQSSAAGASRVAVVFSKGGVNAQWLVGRVPGVGPIYWEQDAQFFRPLSAMVIMSPKAAEPRM